MNLIISAILVAANLGIRLFAADLWFQERVWLSPVLFGSLVWFSVACIVQGLAVQRRAFAIPLLVQIIDDLPLNGLSVPC